MKSSPNTSSKLVYVPASRAQKIWGVVALAGLFACGLMIGVSIRGNNQSHVAPDTTVQFTESQCDTIAGRIDSAINNYNYDKLEQLKKIYAESCDGHIQAKIEVVATPEKKLSTCEKIEKLLLRNLYAADSQNPYDHNQNAELYNKLSQHGCPENSDAYKQLVAQETAIANALGAPAQNLSNNMRTCEEIELVLQNQIFEYPSNSHDRMQNAEIYSTMAERGCPENAQKYKELALRQIDVVSAVSDEQELIQNKEAIVDTYEKLQMQEAARNFLNKIDKLINPATDFIFELERVINE